MQDYVQNRLKQVILENKTLKKNASEVPLTANKETRLPGTIASINWIAREGRPDASAASILAGCFPNATAENALEANRVVNKIKGHNVVLRGPSGPSGPSGPVRRSAVRPVRCPCRPVRPVRCPCRPVRPVRGPVRALRPVRSGESRSAVRPVRGPSGRSAQSGPSSPRPAHAAHPRLFCIFLLDLPISLMPFHGAGWFYFP